MRVQGRQPSRSQRSHRVTLAALAALAAIIAVMALAWRLVAPDAKSGAMHITTGQVSYPPTAAKVDLPHQRVYSLERHPEGVALMASDVDGAEVQVSILPDHFGSEDSDAITTLALSPDQRYLALNAQRDHGDTVWLVSTTTGNLHLVPSDAEGLFLQWMPDGAHFLFRPFLPIGAYNGTWNPGLWIVDATSGSHVDLPLPEGLNATQVVDASPSPDGKQIILSVSPELGAGSSVWMVTPDGTHQQQLFTSSDEVGLFTWSPDGSQIAYQSIVDSNVPFLPSGVWTMTAATGAHQQIAQADGGHGERMSWSLDGQQLAFVARLNPESGEANDQAGALVSAVRVANLSSGVVTDIAGPDQSGMPRNLNPTWQSDGSLLFTAMAASDAYGAAISNSSLWRATPTTLSSTGNAAPSFRLASVGSTSTGFAGFVAIVP